MQAEATQKNPEKNQKRELIKSSDDASVKERGSSAEPRCQAYEQRCWLPTAVCQLGDIDSAEWTVCSQQTKMFG